MFRIHGRLIALICNDTLLSCGGSITDGHLESAKWVSSLKSRNTRYVTFSKLLKFYVPRFLLLQNKNDYSISLIANLSLKPTYLHAGECVKEWVLRQWRHSNPGGTATWWGCCIGLNNCWDPFQLRISLNSKGSVPKNRIHFELNPTDGSHLKKEAKDIQSI